VTGESTCGADLPALPDDCVCEASVRAPARAPPRDRGPDAGGDVDGPAPADDDESDDPDDPDDPVVSANATGIDATADPTPNATASAPTRPT